MSGPAVAIGFILLIPSILGMIVSGLFLFLGAIPYRPESAVEDSDTQFRRMCINTPASLPVTTREEFCQCTLAEYKASNSTKYANDVCSQRPSLRWTKELSFYIQISSKSIRGAPRKNRRRRKALRCCFILSVSPLAPRLRLSSESLSSLAACLVGCLL
jgi:hypothetical protein